MLYLVATPIGNLKDITLRALEVLEAADVIACEDKRVSSKLLSHYGIVKPRNIISYHDHNATRVRPQILSLLAQGKSVAYITDGGMPLISDPGFKLVVACQTEKLSYTIIPGPSAPLAALCLSGLSPDRFFFCGFLPPKQSARRSSLEEIRSLSATLLFFESPKRLVAFLTDALDVFGDRTGAVCREMTKLYEEVQKAPLSTLIAYYEANPPRGEIVIALEGAPKITSFIEADIMAELQKAVELYPVKEAVDIVSKIFNKPKREIYQRALSLKSEKTGLS